MTLPPLKGQDNMDHADSAMLAVARERDALRGLCAELAAVLAAHGASSNVMEQVGAARNGQPMPHETLLPYTPSIPAPNAAHKKVSELSLALAFSLCALDIHGVRRDVRKAQEVLEELRGMLIAPEAEPITVEVVAVTRDQEGGLFLDWTLEGGIDALESGGMKILVAHGDITDAHGRGEVYSLPPCSSTSPQYRAGLYDEVWSKAREMGYGNVVEALAELERLKAAAPAARQLEVPDAFTHDNKAIERLLNATALIVETPCADSGALFLSCLADVEALLAVEQPGAVPDLELRHTDPWDSARVGDYNAGWNDRHMAGMRDSEQPDAVNLLTAALKPFADAFEANGLPQYRYRETDAEHAAFLDENQVTPARGITMGQFRRAWEVLSGESVLRGVEQQEGEA